MRATKHLLISQSIMWATALLVVALLEEKQSTLFLLSLLATGSFLSLVQQTSKSTCS